MNRKKSKKRNALVHPSWEELDKAKEQCSPQNINFGEREVSVSITDAMIHYMGKLIKDDTLYEKLVKMKRKNPNLKYELVYKWGADGASYFSHYKNATKDTSLFASNMVPTFIEAIDESTGESFNVWSNPFANSAYGVVPLRWAFEKETTGEFFHCGSPTCSILSILSMLYMPSILSSFHTNFFRKVSERILYLDPFFRNISTYLLPILIVKVF